MYATNEFTSDGVTDVYTLSFEGAIPGYLDEDHINVYYDDVLTDAGNWTLTTDTTITLDPIPDNGVVITIRRESDITELMVDYEGGSLLSEDNLDTANTQLLYLIQELADRIEALEDE
jgi:hypothetical protein